MKSVTKKNMVHIIIFERRKKNNNYWLGFGFGHTFYYAIIYINIWNKSINIFRNVNWFKSIIHIKTFSVIGKINY